MVPGILAHDFIGLGFISGFSEFITRVDPAKDRIETIKRLAIFVIVLNDLPQFFFQIL